MEFLTLCYTSVFFKVISAMKYNSSNLERKKAKPQDL